MTYALSYAYLFGIDSEEVEFVNHYKMPESFVDIMLDINNYKTLTEDRYLYLPYDFLLTVVAKALNIEKEKIKDSVCIADELI